MHDRYEKQREANRLEAPVELARELALKLGLDPYPVNYWVVDHDEMNQLIAYDGFQRRYPHWRWGMQYDRQRKKDRFGMGKAFEIVNNDDPSNAFLQASNTLADQKAVITHVEAHADFFRNNEWFGLYRDDRPTPANAYGDGGVAVGGTDGPAGDDEGGRAGPDAAAMLARHGERIAAIMDDPSVDRADVERFIDAVLCLTDTIDQHTPFAVEAVEGEHDLDDLEARLDDLDVSEEVRRQVFDEEWLAERAAADAERPENPREDVLAFIRDHGRTHDDEEGKAVDREPWQEEVLEILRREAYYFAPQKMTKVMNEGWAAFWESLMMADEGFAGDDEVFTYADHMSRVLGSPGFNPYAVGKELWEYVENTANRREVADKLLRVDGITPATFKQRVDVDEVLSLLAPDEAVDRISPETLADLDPTDPRVDADALARARGGELDVAAHPWRVLTHEGLAERHYSLCKPQHRGFLRRISREALDELHRYMFDDAKYATVAEAVADVDRTAGWERMREVRESHNDVTFVDAFLTQEFVREHGYFAYEYSHAKGDYRVTSTDVADVRKKLLLRFTNFGKPTVVVYDGNFDNRGELLLGHQYNGVAMDLAQAKQVLERTFYLWGRPVNLATVVKEVDGGDSATARPRDEEPEAEERGVRIRYDGERFSEQPLDADLDAELSADEVDYDTKPEDWLA